MQRIVSWVIASFLLFQPLFAQLSAPRAEAVYGGRIRAISSVAIGPDSSRVFISTESANSMFYTDVYVPAGGTPVFQPFQVVPSLDDQAGFGGGIEFISGHGASRTAWFMSNRALFSTSVTDATPTQVAGPGIGGFTIEGDHLIYLLNNQLHFGTLDASGVLTPSSASPMMVSGIGGRVTIQAHPVSKELYFYEFAGSPKLYHLPEPYDAISGSVFPIDRSPTTLSPTMQWQVFGIAPDGTLCIAGSDVHSKHLATSASIVDPWTSYNTGLGGAAGGNLAFGGDSSHYYVYFGSAYNDNKGLSGGWKNLGIPGGSQTHPNDGPVWVDPNNPKVVYLTTDMGIGATEDGGATIFEINDGVEAVQVKDFDMTADKTTAWIASKSGIRKVSTYTTSPSWTEPIFPNGDGSPYYAVAMAAGDTNVVYAGNLRVYKTLDGGRTWSHQFSAEQAPYHFPAFGTPTTGAAWITSIKVCPFDKDLVLVGYQVDRNQAGGLFCSYDGGANWEQVLIESGSIGFDVDVHDMVFTKEGTDTVVYVGVEYDLAAPTGRSAYRLVKQGKAWLVSQDMSAGSTSTGSLIVASIRDLDVSLTGDTIFAVGTDAGSNHPIAYYKDLNATGLWTPFTTSGFPAFPGAEGKAITLGIDTVYVAVNNEVYFHAIGSGKWELGYSYPVGTEINFLYYDELLVGTGTGLYGHVGLGDGATSLDQPRAQPRLAIYPNPASDLVTIPLPETPGLYEITLYDLAGRLVQREQLMGRDAVISVSGWKPGVYLVRLRGQGIDRSAQLIKE